MAGSALRALARRWDLLDPPTEVHVCQAETCRSRGAKAVLAEIEELGAMVSARCSVRETGCLGYCSEGPAALVIKHDGAGDPCDPFPPPTRRVHVKIESLDATVRVVHDATGEKPEPKGEAQARFAMLLAARAREQARGALRWNTALRGLADEAAQRPALRAELEELMGLAGYPLGVDAAMPRSIHLYSQWSLESVTPVSKHSAVFHLRSTDPKRGTPHPRGRGRTPTMVTWHTTMLAEVGPNDEGPLPYIERDYTPVSSAKEWEHGTVDLLIKLYQDGAATSWLHRAAPARVWLSRPQRTLNVPTLTAGDDSSGFQPASVLLMLAGTGVVALPQVLHHRDPQRKLGMSTARGNQLRVPIDALLSFRDDDVLHLPYIADCCRQGTERGLRRCTLLLTPASAAGPPHFADAAGGDGDEAARELRGLANATILQSRITPSIVADAIARMPPPCRVVVSGPDGFNTAARSMLSRLVDDDQVTVLSA